jgi:hypothetical protein
MLCWLSYCCIVHSISAAMNNYFCNTVNLFVVSRICPHSALGQSSAQHQSCSVRLHNIDLYVTCQKIYFCVTKLFVNRYSQANTHHFSVRYLCCNSQSRYFKMLVNHWHCLSYCVLIDILLVDSSVLTITNPILACLLTAHIDRINLAHVVWHSNPAAVSFPNPQFNCLSHY